MWGYHEGIGLVVWGVRQFNAGQGDGHQSRETPLEVAQRRLARGEISKEEFEEIRKSLWLIRAQDKGV